MYSKTEYVNICIDYNNIQYADSIVIIFIIYVYIYKNMYTIKQNMLICTVNIYIYIYIVIYNMFTVCMYVLMHAYVCLSVRRSVCLSVRTYVITHACRQAGMHALLVGGFNHPEKYESQWEGLSHI